MIESGGIERTFRLDVPASALRGAPVPLVLVFHGVNGSATYLSVTGFDAKAREEGFIAAAGNGTRSSWNSGVCQNPDGRFCVEDVDDVRFTRDMVAAIQSEYCIDPSRIFATGFSKGAAMTFRLACEASDLFAAFAPISGGLAFFPCEPEQPRSIQIISSPADPTVPPAIGEFSFEEFLKVNACNGVRRTSAPAATATCSSAPECAAGATTEFCLVEGVGHHWPGGATDPSGVFDATDAVWEFFSK